MTLYTAVTPSSHYVDDDTFWPAIDVAELRRVLTLSSTISEARLKVAMMGATSKIHRLLATWRFKLRQQGYRHLNDVPAPTVNNCSILVTHYFNAIETATASELYQLVRVAECGRPCPPDPFREKSLSTGEARHYDD